MATVKIYPPLGNIPAFKKVTDIITQGAKISFTHDGCRIIFYVACYAVQFEKGERRKILEL